MSRAVREVGGVPGMLEPRRAARRFLLLSFTRWLPVGLTFGMAVLLPLERGMSLASVGVILAAQGLVTLVLEIPTGSIADTWGRRPLLIVAGALACCATVLYLLAQDLWVFALASALQGVYRALDSGPLEAWFVDAVLEPAVGRARAGVGGLERAGADAREPAGAGVLERAGAEARAGAPSGAALVERSLARAGTMVGVAIAGGAVAGGALVAWHPFASQSAFVLPFALSACCIAVHTLLTALLVKEPRGWATLKDAATPTSAPAPSSMTAPASGPLPEPAPAPTPDPVPARDRRGVRALVQTMVGGWRLVRTSPVLRGLILVEVLWALAMLGFETLTPLRLAELLDSEAAAGALFAPASAAAWALYALGSWVAAWAGARWGVARSAMLMRVLNALMVVTMGLMSGLVGLLAGYALAYLSHGAAGPLHSTLLHRCASSNNRALVLSLNSMVSSGTYALATLAVLPLVGAWGSGAMLVVLGAVSAIGALFYLPALRQERREAESVPAVTSLP